MKRALILCLLLAGCGAHTRSAVRSDAAYDNAMETGRSVFDLGHPAQAEGQYQDAMRRALLRDDVAAIHDAGFNLATVQLDQDNAAKALETFAATRAALRLRGAYEAKDLSLIEAAARFRLNDAEGTVQAAQSALVSAEPEVAARAAYLTGLGAARLGNAGLVLDMIDRLGASKTVQVDRKELKANLSLLQHDYGTALILAEDVVSHRRDDLDYGGMRHALLLAAQAADGLARPDLAAAFRKQERESAQNGVSR